MSGSATIMHELSGRIVSINRPTDASRVIVLPQAGEFALKVELAETPSPSELVHSHVVDPRKPGLVPHHHRRGGQGGKSG